MIRIELVVKNEKSTLAKLSLLRRIEVASDLAECAQWVTRQEALICAHPQVLRVEDLELLVPLAYKHGGLTSVRNR